MLASSDQRNCPAIVIGQKLALSGTNADFFWRTRREAWRRQLAASLAPAVTTVRAPRLDRVACDRLADRCAATAGAARRENNGFNRKTNGHVWLSQPRTKLNSQTILCLLRTACVLLLLRVFRWAPMQGSRSRGASSERRTQPPARGSVAVGWCPAVRLLLLLSPPFFQMSEFYLKRLQRVYWLPIR